VAIRTKVRGDVNTTIVFNPQQSHGHFNADSLRVKLWQREDAVGRADGTKAVALGRGELSRENSRECHGKVVAQVAAWLASRVSNGKQQQVTVVSCCLREEERENERRGLPGP
jgi:hypothetical protein